MVPGLLLVSLFWIGCYLAIDTLTAGDEGQAGANMMVEDGTSSPLDYLPGVARRAAEYGLTLLG